MPHTTVLADMQQTRERFFTFISKLEEKLKDFTEAAIPELAALAKEDAEDNDRAYHRMKSAVLGQIDGIRKKAEETKEEKITDFPRPYGNHEIDTAYLTFRNECYARVRQLEDLYMECRKRIENAYVEDYEAQYQKILADYEAVKNKFSCVQCGSPITIDKLYFTTTYISCPACQTRNTFDPGSQAKSLEGLGRSLAEQRTEHLLKEHGVAVAEAQNLFQQVHRLRMDLSFKNDAKNELTEALKERERQWKDAEDKSHRLYQTYLRAMFDEWNRINPALSEQHEGFYNRLWNEYLERN